jgi:hypothetical protein
MLQKIRDKISGWFATVFLGAIAVVFIFWGIRFESSATASAAKVNGERIPLDKTRKAWQERQAQLQQVLRDELPDELVKSEQKRLLDDMIRRELLKQQADKLGYRVGDRKLADDADPVRGAAGRRQVFARSLCGAAAPAGTHRGRVRAAASRGAGDRRAAQGHRDIRVS